MNTATKRTTQGLRDMLFSEIDELRNGTGDIARAKAISNLAKQIIGTAKVEMDYIKSVAAASGDGSKSRVKMGSLRLGSD